MKAIYYILAIALLSLTACSSSQRATSNYDDIYYQPNDKYLNDYSYQEEENEYENVEERQETGMTNKYDDSEPYSGQQTEPRVDRGSQNYRSGNGDTYIENYYESPYDYYYSSRIRRFHRPYSGFGYYSGCYTDYRWYDPYYNGVSIYMNWGTPWYARSPYFNRYNRFPYHSYYYNSWYNDPWYSPYGFGGNHWSYNTGYRHGYYNGFYNGYYYGSGGYYGNNWGYYNNYNEGSPNTSNNFYYGPRMASGSNSGMQGGRSSIKYGKNNDGKSGKTGTINQDDRRRATTADNEVKEQKVRNQQGTAVGKATDKQQDAEHSGTISRRGTTENKNVAAADKLKPAPRTVSSRNTDYVNRGSMTSGASGGKSSLSSNTPSRNSGSVSRSTDRQDVRRKDFIENRNYQTERKLGGRTGNASRYEPEQREERSTRYTNNDRNYRNKTQRDQAERTERRSNWFGTSRDDDDNSQRTNRSRRNYEREAPSRRNYSTPSRNRSTPSRNYSSPSRNSNNSSPRRNYSAPERNDSYSKPNRNSGNRNYSSPNRNSGSRNYSSPSRNRSSGSSGSSRGGSINRSSSPSNSGNSSGGRRHR